MSIKDLVVPALKDYEYYKAAGQDYRIILNANEHYQNFLGTKLQDDFIDRIKSIDINRYPDPYANKLREKYGKLIGVDPENLIATSGSDEGITIINNTFMDKDDVAVSYEPTFSMYKQAAILAKGKYIGLDSDKEDLSPDVDKLIDEANKNKAKIVYICTPNNPTGYLYSKEEIKKVIDNTKGLVIIDEAYIHFAEDDNMDLLGYSDRVVILRTLSKAFSGAGLRVGFIIANKEIIKFLFAAKAPYNLSVTSQTAGEVLVDNHELIEDELKVIKRERDRMVTILKNYKDILILPLNANFITIKTSKAQILYDECEKRSISIRAYGNELKDVVRITVGSKEENDEVIDAIKEVF
ncbi:histidinol-phosphate transaminase [uncultured Anaerofustis sp.]|uniref:histidinol-phosphate transaminase n=1 Tax=uncultured Anaerofustis sp. TaxID=904996 RepID=UPI0025EF0A93|nr:histidinol-phosphate transaminase [uncultured Anaerofustis sp.]